MLRCLKWIKSSPTCRFGWKPSVVLDFLPHWRRDALFKQVHTLREELTAIFDAPVCHEQAQHRFECWQAKVEQSDLTCFDKFLRTLENWREEILNYFKKRFNSDFVEGLNNKIKTIK